MTVYVVMLRLKDEGWHDRVRLDHVCTTQDAAAAWVIRLLKDQDIEHAWYELRTIED